MPRLHGRITTTPAHSSAQPSPLFRTRNWLGRERVAFIYRNRRYVFRHVKDAVIAQQRFALGRRSYTGWIRVVSSLIVIVFALWMVSLQPMLLLQSVDAARVIVGPGPVAYVESQVFRLGTLVRELRVSLGDTAPRWRVQGAVAMTQPLPTVAPLAMTSKAGAVMSTVEATHTALPSATPTAYRDILTVARGGNLRKEPQIDDTNVLGWVLPGDQLEVVNREQRNAQDWLQVRLVASGQGENAQPLPNGAQGWISALLLQQAPTPAPPSATPTATAALLFHPTPIPPAPLVSPTPLPQPTAAAPTTSALLPPGNWALQPVPVVFNDGQVPNEGQWQMLPAATDGGTPAMAVTTFRPDASRPDIQVAIAAIDLSRAELHMVAGSLEPESDITTTLTLQRDGRIPISAYPRLLAAFNGGFKAIHGSDGMGVGGVVYRQPVEGRATVAAYTDGTVRIGLPGRDLSLGAAAVAWRQNGYLLVDSGQVTTKALEGGLGWGTSVDKQVETWRSGLGISADGRTLFYAVGDALTSARLAEALRSAGAWSALQLDINNYWVRFVSFQQGEDGQLVAQPLISAMLQEPKKYLGSEERDFMYLTIR